MTKALFPALLLTCVASGLSACGTGEASIGAAASSDRDVAVPVDVTHPRRLDLFASYSVTTTIGSEGDAPVLARVPGEVVDLLVEEGDWVEQGQVLARLDGERLRLEMLAAMADLKKARGEYERNKDLNRRGLVSAAMFDGLRYDVDELNATYELRKLDYEYSNIRATITGYVSERNIKLGENISTGQETFRITDTSELVAYLQIPQNELGKFTKSHPATLRVDSMPEKSFTAEIVRISPTIDIDNGTFRATAFIDNSDGLLAPGMFSRFQVNYEKHPSALTIPLRALLNDDDDTSVFVVNDGQIARRRIRTGITSGGVVEVLEGLTEDDEIVVVGQSSVREGSRVLARGDNTSPTAG